MHLCRYGDRDGRYASRPRQFSSLPLDILRFADLRGALADAAVSRLSDLEMREPAVVSDEEVQTGAEGLDRLDLTRAGLPWQWFAPNADFHGPVSKWKERRGETAGITERARQQHETQHRDCDGRETESRPTRRDGEHGERRPEQNRVLDLRFHYQNFHQRFV